MSARDPDPPSTAVNRELLRRLSAREAEHLIRQMDEAARPGAVRFTGAQLDAMAFPPLVMTVPGILPDGVGLLAGKPKAGKSWLAYAWALALAAGGTLLGCLNGQPPRPVLYFALEDSPRRLRDRRAALGYPATPPLLEYCTQAAPDQVMGVMHEWMGARDGMRPAAVIDTWGKVAAEPRKGESAYAADYRTGGYLKWVAGQHPGSTVLAVHHTRKQAAEDYLDTVSGTSGIAGSADTILVLARRRGEQHAILHVTGRDVDENRYQLDALPAWALAGGSLAAAARAAETAGDSRSLSGRSQAIAGHVRQAGTASTAQVAQAAGISPDQAAVYLRRLWQAGQIGKQERGIWTADTAGRQADEAGRQADGDDESVGSVGKQPRVREKYVSSVGSVGINQQYNEQTGPYARARSAREAGRHLPDDWQAEAGGAEYDR